MARLPTIRTIRVEDISPPGDQEEWVRRMVVQMNLFMQSAYSALDRNLTFDENISAQIKELTFRTDAAYSSGTWENIQFASTLPRNAKEVRIMQLYKVDDPYTAEQNALSLQWLDLNRAINITYISGLSDNTEYFVRFMVT